MAQVKQGTAEVKRIQTEIAELIEEKRREEISQTEDITKLRKELKDARVIISSWISKFRAALSQTPNMQRKTRRQH
jgi:hypothetical protein